jgi:pyridoxamine 5'-phosphate oxidase
MAPQLTDIFTECWNKLENAGGKDSALRNMVVCNYAPDDINAYTVVLREADGNKYSLTFYTDYRSPKVEQLQLSKKVSVVMYSDEEKLQLSLKGEASIHYQDDVALHYWQKNGYKGKRSYLAKPAPSTIISEPADGLAYLQGNEFEEDDPVGYENFAVVTIAVNYLEYLQLSREGNRRAKFTRDNGSEWQGMWLIP